MKIKDIKLYPLSDGKYVVSYFDPVRKIRIQKTFTEEFKAKSYITELKAPKSKSSEFGYLKSTSTEEAIRVYLEQVPNSSLSKSPKLIREFVDFFSLHGVPRLNHQNLESFFIHLKNEHNHSDRSLLLDKSRLQGFFKFLVKKQVISKSPLDGIKFNRGGSYTRPPIIFSKKETLEFISLAKKYSPALFYPIFLLVHETAAKTSDILNLHWKDINFKTQTMELFRSTELQKRSFSVSDELIEAFQRIDIVSDHVFTNLEGLPLKKHILGRELKKFQTQAGLDTKWNLLDLITSFGLAFLKAGGNIEDLQKIMGHQNVATTKDIFNRHLKFKPDLSGHVAVQGSRVVTQS